MLKIVTKCALLGLLMFNIAAVPPPERSEGIAWQIRARAHIGHDTSWRTAIPL